MASSRRDKAAIGARLLVATIGLFAGAVLVWQGWGASKRTGVAMGGLGIVIGALSVRTIARVIQDR
jgi:hypothetical protein